MDGLRAFLVSWICFYFGQTLLFAYVIGFALIQLALALVHTSNQSIIFRLRPDAKSRINALYDHLLYWWRSWFSIRNFAWNHGGWSMTCLAGVGLVVFCILFSVIDAFLQKKQLAQS